MSYENEKILNELLNHDLNNECADCRRKCKPISFRRKIENNFQNCTHFVVKKKSTQFCFGF